MIKNGDNVEAHQVCACISPTSRNMLMSMALVGQRVL